MPSVTNTLIFKFCSYLGIVPFYKRKEGKLKRYPLYTFILLAFIIGTFSLRFYNVFRLSEIIDVFFFETMISLLLLLVIIWSSKYHTIIWYFYFDEFDRLLIRHNGRETPMIRHEHAKFILHEAQVVLLYGLSTWFGIYVKIEVEGMLITYLLFAYLGNIYAIELLLLDLALQRLYTLKQVAREMCLGKERATIDKLNNLSKLHCIICNIVDLYNESLGWPILFQIIYTSFTILSAINYLLYPYTFYILTSYFFICISFTLGNLIRLILRSNSLTTAFCEVSREADKLLHNQVHEVFILDALKMFSHQTQKQPKISAADFFTVDLSLIYSLFGLLSTFVILIVQYRLAN